MKLKPSKQNPRKISQEALQKLYESIKRDPKFMEIRPIVCDEHGNILAGNMRYKACVSFGEEIKASWIKVVTNLTESQKKRFILVDNSPEGMSGEWDMEILQNNWDIATLNDLGFNIIEEDLPKYEDYYEDLEELNESLAGSEDASITITVPKRFEDQIRTWLANGEMNTSPGLGKGVMKRCGLL